MKELGHRFVCGGGWIWQERVTKPKTAAGWVLAAGWFCGWAMAFSYFSDVTMALWTAAGLGQVVLVAAAAVIRLFEKPVLKTTLVRNPETKPECLY